MGQKIPALTLMSATRTTRVIIADPFPVVLCGLRTIILDNPRFVVVAESATMPGLRKKAAARRPDVILIDWAMALQDLASARDLLRTSFLIFLTVSENTKAKKDLLDLGNCAFLSKWSSARKLQAAALHACNNQQRELAAEVGGSEKSAREPFTRDERGIARLTSRERQLLPLICSGLKNKEIALHLGIAETTVWHHLTSIFAKLTVVDRVGLVRFAYRHRMVLPGEPARAARGSAGQKIPQAEQLIGDVQGDGVRRSDAPGPTSGPPG